MKRLSLFIIGTMVLSGCSAAPFGNGTAMQHGNGMMHGEGGMMHGEGGMMQGSGDSNFLPGQNVDIASLPEAMPTEVMEIRDGQTITLTPTLVRSSIRGKSVAMYGYNGQIPGPLLKTTQGSRFTVRVKNSIDRPTSVHWHGLRLENKNDGAVGMTQEAIEPGDSFTYTIDVPDEGIYWYHTHVREDVQQPMGLYGGILVTPSSKDAYASVDDESILMLNDMLLDSEGLPVPYGNDGADHTLMGRFGNMFIVNNVETPVFDVALGSVHRYYVVNASNTRTYRIVAPPKGRMKLVGGDGGRYEREEFARSVTISPSERLIVEIEFVDDEVSRGAVASKVVPIVVAGTPRDPTTVLSADIVGGKYSTSETFGVLRTNDDVIRSIDPFRKSFDKDIDHTLVLDMGAKGGMNHGGMMMGHLPADGIEWEDNGMSAMPMADALQWKLVDEETGDANEKLTYVTKVGDVLKIRIVNKKDSMHPMQHPIHFHGQRFLVLSDDGVATKNFVWKDTVLVPAGHTVDILVDVSNPGDWMFHCHIAEHLSSGMMGLLRVR